MCLFSGAVNAVADTNIFARLSGQGSQFLVYSMNFSADAELAMILPLPVPKNAAEDAVQFINLASYPDFFTDLYEAFPRPRTVSFGLTASFSEPLEVVSVGSFDASFVPTITDFQRLDARFRLPSSVWQSLPAYQNYGFAVFKLKSGDLTVHPMAFEFPTIEPTRLFFPTLHMVTVRIHLI